jgi:hypothetical protein
MAFDASWHTAIDAGFLGKVCRPRSSRPAIALRQAGIAKRLKIGLAFVFDHHFAMAGLRLPG